MESHYTPLGRCFSTSVTDQSNVQKLKIQAQMDFFLPNLLLPTWGVVMLLLHRNIKKRKILCVVFPPMCKQCALGAIRAGLLRALGWRRQHIHYLKILMSGDKSQQYKRSGCLAHLRESALAFLFVCFILFLPLFLSTKWNSAFQHTPKRRLVCF